MNHAGTTKRIIKYVKNHRLFMGAGLTALGVLSQVLLFAMGRWIQTTYTNKPNEGFVANYWLVIGSPIAFMSVMALIIGPVFIIVSILTKHIENTSKQKTSLENRAT